MKGYKYGDTSSSIYPGDRHYNSTFSTPSPVENNYNDDVYRQYVTPPTPFETSTQEKNNKDTIAAINPYAQSLWYAFRGNDDSQIGAYGYDYKKADNNEEKVTSLMPSLMDKKLGLNLGKIQTNDSVGQIGAVDLILKPLNDPPPYRLISIQAILVKKLKGLVEMSDKFDSFIKDNTILVNSKIKICLFSNIKTLLLIHEKFYEILLNNGKNIDIEQHIYDYLQRLYHVYPSYLRNMDLRNHLTKKILNNSKFKSFIKYRDSNDGMFDNEEGFYHLIVSPSTDFQTLLHYLDEYIGKSSPRINVLISKFLEHYDNSLGAGVSLDDDDDDDDEPLYLEIPYEWKNKHKLNWKEISGMRLERQLAYFLRFEIKRKFQKYEKIKILIRNQIEQISKAAVINNHISNGFIKFQTGLPNSSDGDNMEIYRKYLSSIEIQNKKIYAIIKKMDKFTNGEKYRQIEFMVHSILKSSKKIINKTDKDRECLLNVDNIFGMYKFQIHFNESIYLLFINFVLFIQEYHDIMANHRFSENNTIFDTSEVVYQFKINQMIQQEQLQNEAAQLEQYNDQLGHACAKGRLMKRFFA